jgi:hypothetical protein
MRTHVGMTDERDTGRRLLRSGNAVARVAATARSDYTGVMAVDDEAARRGLLASFAKQGGSSPDAELHTHSLVFYQAGSRRSPS